MKILVIDIGGTNVKVLATGHEAPRKFRSGPTLTPEQMVDEVKTVTADWSYDVISIGYPGPVLCGTPMVEPVKLGRGWMGFDFAAAFGKPVKLINDAAMQALGSYQSGKMLFLGLGTGIGAAVVVDGHVEALEIGRFHYKKRTLEHYIGNQGFKRLGRKKWHRLVEDLTTRMMKALHPTDVVLGGGNAKKLDPLPPGTRLGDNSFAFIGGYRLWQPRANTKKTTPSTNGSHRAKAAPPKTKMSAPRKTKPTPPAETPK